MLEVAIQHRLGAFALDATFVTTARITALFGRSGCGKTSILNAIAGVSRPQSGRIALNGRVFLDVAQNVCLSPNVRDIGYVFQQGLLFPHLNVADNLFFSKRLSEDTPRARRLIELLGLGALLKRRPRDLSGGETQRVAIGRALLSNPSLLLLDEPLASLDAQRKHEVLTHIEQLRDEVGIPIVMVSHSIDEVIRLAEHMVLLEDGRVKAAGAVDELLARLDLAPATGRHEAGAVIDAEVASHDVEHAVTLLRFDGGELTIPRVVASPGHRLRVRLRARDVSLALQRPVDISINNILEGTLLEIRDEVGAIVDVSLRVGEARILARVTRLSLGRLRLQPGQRVYALVKAVSIDRHSVGYA